MGFPAGDKEALTAAVKEICGWIDTAGPKKMIVQLVGDLSPIEAWNISEEMQKRAGDDAGLFSSLETVGPKENGSIS